MKELKSLGQLPAAPAVYALYGGRKRAAYVAYVGAADSLKQRIYQHLVRRDSSVATGVSAAGLRPELVTKVQWWEHPCFGDRARLMAAELVAFDVLAPALRSRGAIQEGSRILYADSDFCEEMRLMFGGDPSGRVLIPTLLDALDHIDALERRLAILESRLDHRD